MILPNFKFNGEDYIYTIYFFNDQNVFIYHANGTEFNEKSNIFEIKENVLKLNSFSNGVLLTDIRFKNKTVPKYTTFSISDVEIFDYIKDKKTSSYY